MIFYTINLKIMATSEEERKRLREKLYKLLTKDDDCWDFYLKEVIEEK